MLLRITVLALLASIGNTNIQGTPVDLYPSSVDGYLAPAAAASYGATSTPAPYNSAPNNTPPYAAQPSTASYPLPTSPAAYQLGPQPQMASPYTAPTRAPTGAPNQPSVSAPAYLPPDQRLLAILHQFQFMPPRLPQIIFQIPLRFPDAIVQ